MSSPPRPELAELSIADPPSAWAQLGFTVHDDGALTLGGVTVRLGATGQGIGSWTLRGIPPTTAIDGLATTVAEPEPEPEPELGPDAGDAVADAPAHPNGAIGIDHVVIATPAFDRTAAALDDAGLSFRRIRTVGDGEGAFRQGFRRIGPAILEVVELAGRPVEGPSSFWGLVVNVTDIDALAARLGPERCSAPKDAVQPGRRIATLRRSAGLSPAVAFMTPE